MVFATGDVPGQRCTRGEATALQSLAGPSVTCVSATDSCLQILQFSSPDVGEGREGQCSES